MSSTAPPGVPAGTAGFFCFEVDQGRENRSRNHGPRRRSFSPMTRSKICGVRKMGACLRCRMMKKKCDEKRPCGRCEASIAQCSRSRCLKWMDCTAVSLIGLSIYRSDASPAQNPTQPYAETLYSMLGGIPLPQDLKSEPNIDIMAEDFAAWIAHSDSGLCASKLGLLCISNFQAITTGVLNNFSIKAFRLLIWTTTLIHTARCPDGEDRPRQIEALSNLKKFRNQCGQNVVYEVDRLCRPGSIERLPLLQRRLLFLVVIGLCLSATYSNENSKNPSAPPCDSNKALNFCHQNFIRALAHVATYLGHVAGLLNSSINSSALIDAAERRWDHEGSYSLLMPCSMVDKLQEELQKDTIDAQTQSNPTDQFVLGAASIAEINATPPVTAPETNVANLCSCGYRECDRDPCWGEFMTDEFMMAEFVTIPELDKMLFDFEFNATRHTRVNSDDEQSRDVECGTRSLPQITPPSSSSMPVESGTSPPLQIIPPSLLSMVIEPRPYGRLWFCHTCGDGPKVSAVEPACVTCGHISCDQCLFV